MTNGSMMCVVGICCLAAAVGRAAPVEPDMPVSAWLFDTWSPTVVSDSFGGNDGTPVNMPVGTWSADHPGVDASFAYAQNHCLDLSGTDGYANLGRPSDLDLVPKTDAFTLAAWIRAEDGEYGGLLSKADAAASERQYMLMVRSDGRLSAVIGGKNELVPAPSMMDGTWHHVAVRVDATGQELYLDGTRYNLGDGQPRGSIGSKTLDVDVLIGARNDGGGVGYRYTGQLDELAVWNTALSPENIEWLAQNSLYVLPDPATVVLLVAGATVLLRRRRRRLQANSGWRRK